MGHQMKMVDLRTRLGLLAAAVGVVLALGGCPREPLVVPPPADILEIIPADRWPTLLDDLDQTSLEAACAPSVEYLDRLPPGRILAFGSFEHTAEELARGVERACEIVVESGTARERLALLQSEFLLLRSIGRDDEGEVFFTGYYEPLLDARREPSLQFKHPVYVIPDDLVTVDLRDFGLAADSSRIIGRVDKQRLVPYFDRDDIDFDVGLAAGTEVLGYVDDPVDVFFLHVQGSGTLVFPDGGRSRAGYAATNGRAYRSIGRLLIDDGLVSREEMSMQAIRAYLNEHPDDLRRVLGCNPSYVFFRPLPPAGGPLGCYGEPVTGGRSIATDRGLFPAPVMAWISATVPDLDGSDKPIARFVLNQDTGGSIRGPGRVDLFYGQGDEAGELAGRTKHLGELYFLWPK